LFNPSTGTLTVTGSIIGNIDSSNINELSNYSLGTDASAITTSDTLNSALSKLEYKAGTVYTWYQTVTGTDNDAIINKWSEVVTFLDGIQESE
jgi:hypothetical protein